MHEQGPKVPVACRQWEEESRYKYVKVDEDVQTSQTNLQFNCDAGVGTKKFAGNVPHYELILL